MDPCSVQQALLGCPGIANGCPVASFPTPGGGITVSTGYVYSGAWCVVASLTLDLTSNGSGDRHGAE